MKKEPAIDFKNIPLSTRKPDFKFPDFEVLKVNNIDVYLYPDYTQALVNFRMLFHRGAYYESLPGLSLFTANMLLKGTKSQNAVELSEKFDILGASVSSNSRWDDTHLNLNVLFDKLEPALKLLGECIYEPSFDDNEIERQKKKHTASILQEHSDSSYLAQIAFNSVMFDNIPYSNIRLGTIESIKSINAEKCRNHHKELLENSKTSIVLSGNFDKEHALNLIERLFKTYNNNETDKEQNLLKDSKNNRVVIIEKPGAMQTTLRVGRKSLTKHSPDYFKMQLVNCIFGGNFLSRLNSLLREEKGVTYGVHSSVMSRKFASTFIISTDINQESTAETITDIINEMNKINKNKVQSSETELCIQYILGTFIRSIETPQQVNGLLQGISLFNLEHDFYDRYFNTLSSMGPDNIFPAQEKYMKPEGLVIAASGNISYLKKELDKFGELMIYDNNGNLSAS